LATSVGRQYCFLNISGPTKEPGFFMRAHVQRGVVVWSEDIDLAPDTLYLRSVTPSP
jgi:hypothetical protein